MLLTNHVLTGTLLGLTIENPIVLAPTAVASHLVLDMTPHSGNSKAGTMEVGSPLFIIVAVIDCTASAVVVAAACVAWPQKALNILIGAFGAALPDLIYIPETLFTRKKMEAVIPGYKKTRWFLGHIQWYQEPLGMITEVLWAALMLVLLYHQLP